ncbi:MAG: hypothetical protein CO093_02530 [Alphaproteobacteria bacterium CG_4_9_14_3_um_filter_47_13]|nr:MAG: hypothetical protein CO093_02530 [Alphaproteobacteria bacterium CG_4_9_14_3_um_filter_47_13]
MAFSFFIQKNKAAFVSLGFITLIFLVYSIFWFFVANKIRNEIDAFIINAPSQNIQITIYALSIRNYPFIPTVYFSGLISAEGNVIEIPLLLARSLFLPGSSLEIEMPQGLAILAPVDTALWSFDAIRIEAIIPKSLPAQITLEDLALWKESGQTLELTNLEIEKNTLTIKGNGYLLLDNNLQPAGSLTIQSTGHIEFLHWLQQNQYIKRKEALLSGMVLVGLSQTDPLTKESVMKTVLTVQNRTVSIGPLQLIIFPAFDWP